MSSPLKLRKTSYVHPPLGLEDDEDGLEDEDEEAIEFFKKWKKEVINAISK